MNLARLTTFLDGGRVALGLIVALAFLRLARTSGDRLYLAFSVAFALMCVSSALVGLGFEAADYNVFVFLPRLVAFVVIILAIVDKNRRVKA